MYRPTHKGRMPASAVSMERLRAVDSRALVRDKLIASVDLHSIEEVSVRGLVEDAPPRERNCLGKLSGLTGNGIAVEVIDQRAADRAHPESRLPTRGPHALQCRHQQQPCRCTQRKASIVSQAKKRHGLFWCLYARASRLPRRGTCPDKSPEHRHLRLQTDEEQRKRARPFNHHRTVKPRYLRAVQSVSSSETSFRVSRSIQGSV